MKTELSMRYVVSHNKNVICILNGNADYLLKCKEPYAYTCGKYGWNADVYDIGNGCIVTGDHPFGKIKPDINMTKKYNSLAKQAYEEFRFDYKEQQKRIRNLLDEFLKEVIK